MLCLQVCAYDYSEGFVENMKTKAEELNVSNLEARQGDSHGQLSLYPGRRFDLIFGCNLIDRLHTPNLWVTQSKVSQWRGRLLYIDQSVSSNVVLLCLLKPMSIKSM